MTSSRFPQRYWPVSRSASDRDEMSGDVEGASAHHSTPAEVILSADGEAEPDACATQLAPLRPHGLFVPENYEPNYAYPLVVWLHETGHCERNIVEVLPWISMRNYVGLALRGTQALANESSDTYGWSKSDRDRLAFQDELHASVRHLRRDYHIHSERIFLAGAGDGATMAWDLFLSRPEWFAGVAVFGGSFPWRSRPLRRFRALSGKRVFLAADVENSADVLQAERVGRLLHSAGLEVSARSHRPGRRLSRAMLRHLDFWIMEAIGGCL